MRAALDNIVVQDRAGNVVPGAGVYVYERDTTSEVTVFATDTGDGDVELEQPLTVSVDGVVPGWVEPALVDLQVVGGGRMHLSAGTTGSTVLIGSAGGRLSGEFPIPRFADDVMEAIAGLPVSVADDISNVSLLREAPINVKDDRFGALGGEAEGGTEIQAALDYASGAVLDGATAEVTLAGDVHGVDVNNQQIFGRSNVRFGGGTLLKLGNSKYISPSIAAMIDVPVRSGHSEDVIHNFHLEDLTLQGDIFDIEYATGTLLAPGYPIGATSFTVTHTNAVAFPTGAGTVVLGSAAVKFTSSVDNGDGTWTFNTAAATAALAQTAGAACTETGWLGLTAVRFGADFVGGAWHENISFKRLRFNQWPGPQLVPAGIYKWVVDDVVFTQGRGGLIVRGHMKRGVVDKVICDQLYDDGVAFAAISASQTATAGPQEETAIGLVVMNEAESPPPWTVSNNGMMLHGPQHMTIGMIQSNGAGRAGIGSNKANLGITRTSNAAGTIAHDPLDIKILNLALRNSNWFGLTLGSASAAKDIRILEALIDSPSRQAIYVGAGGRTLPDPGDLSDPDALTSFGCENLRLEGITVRKPNRSAAANIDAIYIDPDASVTKLRMNVLGIDPDARSRYFVNVDPAGSASGRVKIDENTSAADFSSGLFNG